MKKTFVVALSAGALWLSAGAMAQTPASGDASAATVGQDAAVARHRELNRERGRTTGSATSMGTARQINRGVRGDRCCRSALRRTRKKPLRPATKNAQNPETAGQTGRLFRFDASHGFDCAAASDEHTSPFGSPTRITRALKRRRFHRRRLTPIAGGQRPMQSVNAGDEEPATA